MSDPTHDNDSTTGRRKQLLHVKNGVFHEGTEVGREGHTSFAPTQQPEQQEKHPQSVRLEFRAHGSAGRREREREKSIPVVLL